MVLTRWRQCDVIQGPIFLYLWIGRCIRRYVQWIQRQIWYDINRLSTVLHSTSHHRTIKWHRFRLLFLFFRKIYNLILWKDLNAYLRINKKTKEQFEIELLHHDTDNEKHNPTPCSQFITTKNCFFLTLAIHIRTSVELNHGIRIWQSTKQVFQSSISVKNHLKEHSIPFGWFSYDDKQLCGFLNELNSLVQEWKNLKIWFDAHKGIITYCVSKKKRVAVKSELSNQFCFHCVLWESDF